MIADFPPPPPSAAVEAREGFPTLAKRKTRDARQRAGNRPVRASAFVVGAIIVLSDGAECEIVAVLDGQAYCRPLKEPMQ